VFATVLYFIFSLFLITSVSEVLFACEESGGTELTVGTIFFSPSLHILAKLLNFMGGNLVVKELLLYKNTEYTIVPI
jgi:hypothetical protein